MLPRLDEEDDKVWTECTLSKILNGKSSLSLTDLDILASTSMQKSIQRKQLTK